MCRRNIELLFPRDILGVSTGFIFIPRLQLKYLFIFSDEKGENGTSYPECVVCLQSYYHPVKLPCGHIFCFLCVKGVAARSRRCALCRAELPADYFDHPVVVRVIDSLTPSQIFKTLFIILRDFKQ